MSEQFNFHSIYEQLKKLHQEKELSAYEANIFDFVSIIKEKSDLFTAQDRSSLDDLLTTLPDDVVEISNQIAQWYSERSHIEYAIFERPTFNSTRGPANRKVKLTDKEFKELLENCVRESKPSSKSSEPPSQSNQ